MLMLSRLSLNQVSSSGIIPLFKFLESNKTIKILHFEGNNLDDVCMREFGELMSKNSTIEVVLFGNRNYGNRITDIGVNALIPFVKEWKSLKVLDFACNKGITTKSINPLIAIAKNSKIESIDIWGTSINELPIELLCSTIDNSLKNGKTKVSCSEKELTDDDAIHLDAVLKKYQNDIEIIE